MPEAQIVKTQTVLELDDVNKAVDRVQFVHPDRFSRQQDRTHYVERLLRISFRDWSELGQPDRITITMEPGDKLNVNDDEIADEGLGAR
jgi:hypothetical protein